MANPNYSPYLQFAPTFQWGGKSWGANDADAFARYLRKRGINADRWARNHPNAAKVFDPVQQLIYGNVQPQITAIKQLQQERADYYSRLMTSLGAFTNALNGYLSPLAGQVEGMYKSGAQADQALGTGYGTLFDTSQNANAAQGNATLAGLGLNQVVPGSNDKGVVAALGGGLEADILRAAGPAWAKAFGALPGAANLEAQTQMRDLLAQAASANSDFQSQIMQVLQGVPAMQSQYQQQQQSYDLAMRKQRLAEATAAENTAYRNWYIAMQNGKTKEAAYWKRQAQIAENKRIAIEQQNANTSAGRLKLAQQKAAAEAAAAKGKGKGGSLREGETPAAIQQKASGDLQSWLRSHAKSGYTYKAAFQYLYHAYSGYVTGSFKNEAAYRKMINAILASAGIKPGTKVKPNPYGG